MTLPSKVKFLAFNTGYVTSGKCSLSTISRRLRAGGLLSFRSFRCLSLTGSSEEHRRMRLAWSQHHRHCMECTKTVEERSLLGWKQILRPSRWWQSARAPRTKRALLQPSSGYSCGAIRRWFSHGLGRHQLELSFISGADRRCPHRTAISERNLGRSGNSIRNRICGWRLHLPRRQARPHRTNTSLLLTASWRAYGLSPHHLAFL